VNDLAPRIDRLELAAIAGGGAAGALARAGLSQAFPVAPGSWPWTTFAINLTGTFLLGWVVTHLLENRPLPTLHHPLLATGLLGTFTTFSTMQLEVLNMIDRHRDGLALAYIAASVVGGYLLVSGASAMARRSRVSTVTR